jgi:hypothetical protein
MSLHRVPLWLLLPVLLFSCAKAKDEEIPPPDTEAALPETDAGTAGVFPFFPPETLVAVLRPGENPLWFDISGGAAPEGGETGTLAGGFRLIDAPARAGLSPFTPWPLTRHVAAVLVREEGLYLAINRDSLLAFLPLEGGDLGLFRLTGGPYWESYTLGNLFIYDDKPALFFYRDDNFAEPAAPPPEPPVLALFPGLAPGIPPGGQNAGVSAAAFYARLMPLEIPALAGIPPGWEADILRSGVDGLWYYRGLRRKNGGRETRYFRVPNLSLQGEEIEPGLYRDSQQERPEPELSALPPLPENFAYTHVVPLGDVTVACWEEQEDYNIGAAGFMVIRGMP